MSEISDELREIADECLTGTTNRRVQRLAVRIDAEMVERPLASDGKPVVDGETLYDSDGREYHVNKLYPLVNVSTSTHSCSMFPDRFTHELPDSWERIADELEAWCDDADVDGDACDVPRDIVERIRKLAKEQGE